MGHFFKFIHRFIYEYGWRRWIGVVTLLTALVFMAGWLRSLLYADGFGFPSRSETAVYSFQSNQDGLCLIKELCLDNPDHWKDNQRIEINSGIRHFGQSLLKSVGAIRHSWLGFEVVDMTNRHSNLRSGPTGDQCRMIVWIVPYWSVTIPLTLLSAFLLLKKPKSLAQKKTPEPTADEGG